jgi:hypothetical protein
MRNDDHDHQNSADPATAKSRTGGGQTDPILKMGEREDWTLSRTVEGLSQKAGVPADRLRRLVLKEIADNGLDHPGATVSVRQIDKDTFVIEDVGPGLGGTPEEIASLYSIRRPMRSTKLLRIPQRGALGNGLRVVAGAVLASNGSLTVTTRGQRIELQPQNDGSTRVIRVTPAGTTIGTKVEIRFGPDIPTDHDALYWAHLASRFPGIYTGKSSPWWYDAPSFHELILAYPGLPLRALIATLDGCSGGRAGEIVTAAGLERATCESVTREQATRLLQSAQSAARPVTPERLGQIGREAFPDHSYAREYGKAGERRTIPFVVEVWARKLQPDDDDNDRDDDDNMHMVTLVNRRLPLTKSSAAAALANLLLCLDAIYIIGLVILRKRVIIRSYSTL